MGTGKYFAHVFMWLAAIMASVLVGLAALISLVNNDLLGFLAESVVSFVAWTCSHTVANKLQ